MQTSYFHFNHRVPLPLLFPPVFTVNDEWLGEELVYDRSRFLQRHEAPLLPREAEGLQSVEDVIHVTHEPSEQKEELQPSKTKATHKTCEQDEGNANDYLHHQEENFGAQCYPNEGHTRATCNACNTRSTNDDTCFTSVNACFLQRL